MKYFILIIFPLNLYASASASDSAKIEIEHRDSTKKNQILILEKNQGDIVCKVASQPPRKLILAKIKDLKFPLTNMKSVNNCDKIITWSYKNKSQKSCYFTKQDTVINDILFDCYN